MNFPAQLQSKFREMHHQGGKWQLGAKMEPFIRDRNLRILIKTNEQEIDQTMKVVNIVAVALGSMAATSEAVKLNTQNDPFWYDEFHERLVNDHVKDEDHDYVKKVVNKYTQPANKSRQNVIK